MESSNIDQIVDYTAAVAATITGVKAVFGSGSGQVDDPLRPGHKVATAESNPTAAFTHWSDVPSAPNVQWVSQTGTVEIAWNVPMRLWLPKTDDVARRAALPFYDRYLRAFVRDRYLGDPTTDSNLALRTELARFAIGGDANWSWLDVHLIVVERVNYNE